MKKKAANFPLSVNLYEFELRNVSAEGFLNFFSTFTKAEHKLQVLFKSLSQLTFITANQPSFDILTPITWLVGQLASKQILIIYLGR